MISKEAKAEYNKKYYEAHKKNFKQHSITPEEKIAKAREITKRWQIINKEKYLEYQKQYLNIHSEKRAATQAKYRKSEKGKIAYKKAHSKYYKNNIEKIAIYYQKNKKRILLRQKGWRKRNKYQYTIIKKLYHQKYYQEKIKEDQELIVKNLEDSYIISILTSRGFLEIKPFITPKMIQTKREQILLDRDLKEFNIIIEEKINANTKTR